MRIGNQAHEHFQHNIYGNLILGAAQAFIYDRLFVRAGFHDFCKLKSLGEKAFQLYNSAFGAMIYSAMHTSSSVMCWLLAIAWRITDFFLEHDRMIFWRQRADIIKEKILIQHGQISENLC